MDHDCLAPGMLQSLLADGVVAGVGAVLAFLPQIAMLFLFVAILEECGYMARAAYLMDGMMSRVGLSGKSFIPLLVIVCLCCPGNHGHSSHRGSARSFCHDSGRSADELQCSAARLHVVDCRFHSQSPVSGRLGGLAGDHDRCALWAGHSHGDLCGQAPEADRAQGRDASLCDGAARLPSSLATGRGMRVCVNSVGRFCAVRVR